MRHTMSLNGATLASPRRDDLLDRSEVLKVGINDVVVALITLVMSLGVLWFGISASVAVPGAFLLHFGIVCIPAGFLALRWWRGGELTILTLLLVTTFAGGPIGAGGSAVTALALWYRRPRPLRLMDWYEYIAGIVGRSHAARIYDELASGRLPSDLAASVPRFTPILNGTSLDAQQRVLAVVGRRYHSDFRSVLRRALRNRDGLIRTQAAAIASRLDLLEKSRLWTTRTRQQ
jgi:hypothetical protein